MPMLAEGKCSVVALEKEVCSERMRSACLDSRGCCWVFEAFCCWLEGVGPLRATEGGLLVFRD